MSIARCTACGKGNRMVAISVSKKGITYKCGHCRSGTFQPTLSGHQYRLLTPNNPDYKKGYRVIDLTTGKLRKTLPRDVSFKFI